MPSKSRLKTGYLKVTGGRVWYGVTEETKQPPVILLHGGPGYPHDYLEPFGDLSVDRQVIFYDQLGCGNSDWPEDKSLWTVDALVNGLREVVEKLGLKQYHILGHSWGPGLATSFALTKPRGLLSLTLASPYLSTPMWEKDAERLIRSLPERHRKAIMEYKKDKRNPEEFEKANKEFYSRFVYRLKRLPKAAKIASTKMNKKFYTYMWGPYEYWPTGTLRDFDVTPRLHEIKIPVLLMCGGHDEASPMAVRHFEGLFPNARMKVFQKGAHFFFWNERKECIKTVRGFLNTVENDNE